MSITCAGWSRATGGSNSDPALDYDRDTLEPALRRALSESWHKATVKLPEHLGRGERPWHLTLELRACAFPGGAPVWDYPDRINAGEVTATRVDGKELRFPTEYMSWEQLEEKLSEFMADWNQELRERHIAAALACQRAASLERELDMARLEQGRALKEFRKVGGLSVPDIANLTGAGLRTVQKYLGKQG